MNSLVLSVCVISQALAVPSGSYYHGPQARPKVLPSGHLADTHEVAAAKAQHLGALAQASSHGSNGHDDGYAGSYNHDGAGEVHDDDIRYHGPIAVPHVLHDGHIADTHEVAAAKTEHLAAVAKAMTHSDGGDERYAGEYDAHSGFNGAHHGDAGYVGAYHGPLAKPVVLADGYLADTHEVAAAKGLHHHALAQASHHATTDYHH